MRPRPVGGLFLLLVLLAGFLGAAIDRPPVLEPSRTPPEIYRHVLHGVAWVHAAGSGKGTGWIVDRDRRWLITCAHVVGDNTSIDVVFPVTEMGQLVAARAYYLEHYPRLQQEGYAVRGKVLRRELETDLALVELASLPPETIALPIAAAGVSPGERVFVVGTRYDSDALWGFTAGSVRGQRVMREGYFSGGKHLAKGARLIEAIAPINEGDSGGPLVNVRGEVVGVCAAVEWRAHGAGLFADRREVLALLDRAGRKPPTPTEPSRHPVMASAGQEVYRQAVRSVALVQGSDPKLRAAGWVVDRQHRLLLTTAAFVGRREKLAVIFPVHESGRLVSDEQHYREPGRRAVSCVLATDARRNLALLEVLALPEDAAELRIAADVPSPGESVHAIGHPQGTEMLWLYNGGWVRQTGHANLGQTMDDPDPAVLLFQSLVSEGEAGAPLLNDRGEIVGVVTGKSAPQQQLAYALTAAEVRAFLVENQAKRQPTSAAEWCARAAVFVKARLYDRALLDCNAAVAAEPTSALACSERARVQHLRGRDDLALADAERALRLDGKLAAAYVHRAAVRNARGEYRAAVADCDDALTLDRDSAHAHAVRAEALRGLGDLDRALIAADAAVTLDPKSALARFTRGLVQAQKNDHARAIEDYSRALIHDPELAPAYRARADSNWARSDVTAALDDYNRALGLNPDDARSLHGRGRALAVRKDCDAALTDFNAAVRLEPRFAPAYLDRGGELLRRGDLDRGFADFAEAVRLHPRLLHDVLLAAERRASDLLREDRKNPALAFAVCRQTLLLLRAQPVVKDRPELRRIVEAGLAIEPQPGQIAEQAAKLREALSAVREGISP